MEIDKRVEDMMRSNISREEHMKIMQALQIRRHEPVVQLSLAMFRDSVIFRDMAQTMIFDLSCQVRDLRRTVGELKDAVYTEGVKDE
jgi:hypothetical protein